ncbi:hypothetical protein TIFTF001_015541 [Ficus carica]|uniref:Uncharacterized protein n=1 Tax=Ficus carica TaxID=3494 RepID=A0AA88A885_FICCA|nr:hypothetical protein TIFTF001_015541 [Ficus carica]
MVIWNYLMLLDIFDLVELKLEHSKLEQLWLGAQSLENLKAIDLSFSKKLIEIPHLSRALNVERLRIARKSFRITWEYNRCKYETLTILKSQPTNICMLTLIGRLELSGCN